MSSSMSSNPQDERFMQRALQLARETAALASPNPQVGCVLVQNNEIIAEGAHLYDNRDHAEIVALERAIPQPWLDVAGATAYVTLEPCSHHGRTPPCADALIAAGITRCVIATVDPNPLVAGQGILKTSAPPTSRSPAAPPATSPRPQRRASPSPTIERPNPVRPP